MQDLPERWRVLQVATRLNVGGASAQVVHLASRLDPQRFESLAVVGVADEREGDMLALRPDLRAEVEERLTIVDPLCRKVRPISDARALAQIAGIVSSFQPHIVHTHMAKAGTLGRVAAALRHVPVVVHTFHGTVFAGHFHPALGRAIASWERLLARRTDALIAVSDAVAGDLRWRNTAPDRVRTVPLGLDLDRFADVPPLSDPIPRVVTLVARLAPVKDVPLFLDAAGIARARLPDLEVRVVGDGPLRDRLRATAPPWVQWLGNRADLPEIFASTGVVALSSRSEGSPVTLIEALASARPVAGVPVGGVEDLLRDRPGALLAPDRSPASLADAIHRALTDPTFASGAELGRARVLEEFDISRLIGDMQSIYAELWDAYRRGDGRRR